MLTLDEARARVLAAARQLPPLDQEQVALDAAYGRILAHDLIAARAVPGFRCSAMDGYAFRLADLGAANPPGGPDPLLGEDGVTLAGATEVPPLARSACRRITTGAPVPEGADTIAMHERTRRLVATDGTVSIQFLQVPPQGANIRQAADDFPAGYRALTSGHRLDAVAIATAAAMGFRDLVVKASPAVGVVTTGDELLPAGASLPFGLRFDSNGPMLDGLLRAHGVHDVERTHVGDDAGRTRSVLQAAVAARRMVILTGGVSAGEADLLPEICSELGELLFWKVAFRPGMPALCARIGDALVFGLPGNPVSVLATFVALVRPALAVWTGCAALDPAPTMARLTEGVAKSHDRLEWRRGTLSTGGDGVAEVAMHPFTGSGALRSLLESNVLVELASDRSDLAEGTLVPVRRWVPV